MTSSACLTLALVHALVWLRQRDARAHGLFALSAMATAIFGGYELWMMRAQTPAEFGAVLRWGHLPVWVLMISLVAFVRVYLRAGRLWLAWAFCIVRTLSLVLNFIFTPNLNYREITGLRHVRFFGEQVAVAEGVPNPWMVVGQLSLLLFVIYIIDASITVWRRGDRRLAVVTGGSIVFFGLAAACQAVLVLWGIIHWPLTASLFYLGLVVVMGYALSEDLLKAANLSVELRESERRMKLAAAATRLAVWRWDIAHDSIWVSANGRPFYGVSPDEKITMRRFLETVHPEDRDGVRESIARSIEHDGDYHADYRVTLPDGTVRWIGARGRVEFNGDRRAQQMLGVSIDITERRQAELEAERQRSELAHLSRVTMLGELSGSLAHELNQPLTAILSNAQAAQRFLAHENADLDEVRAILKDIVDEDKRAGEVIHRLRLLLKKGEVQHQPLDVNEVVREVLKLVRSDLVNQSVTAQTELAPDLPMINADRVQLQQVLLNLVINGCDAMAGRAAGEHKLVIRTALIEGQGIRVSVVDCGAGLAPGKLEQVFEPFFTTKASGMGLGLSVCRSIVTAHGGKLWAANNPERGATFHFTLPVNGNGKLAGGHVEQFGADQKAGT